MRPVVAIFGGGLAGHRLAHRLQHDMNVHLVDPRNYFEVPMAAPRMLVDPSLARRAVIPFSEFLPKVTHHAQRLVTLREGQAILVGDGGQTSELTFDVAVLATGSSWRDARVRGGASTAALRRQQVEAEAEALAKAEHIVIAGGGPVGVEIAAELASVGRGAAVRLVHGGPRLLDMLPPRAGRQARRYLVDRGVTVCLEQTVRDHTPGTVMSSSGEVWSCEAFFEAWGSTQHAAALLDEALSDARGAQGRVKVDAMLRVAGSSTIFAVGDIIDSAEARQGQAAGLQVDVVVKNLQAVASGRAAQATYCPTSGASPMLVTLGPRDGTGFVPWLGPVVPMLTTWMKSRDMMVGRYRRGVGLV